jgi:cytochrome c oxidase subunit 1
VSFLTHYVFSRDHKVIGIQFLISSLIWFLIGGLLAAAMRWQLAWPWSDVPILGSWLFASEGGQISPEYYTMLVTMHGTVMVFFVVIPILAGAFGNYLIPLMIGADDMAFPTLNMFSYWFMWPAFGCLMLAFTAPGFGPAAGWTSYPPLAVLEEAAPGSGLAQTLWLMGLTFVGISSMMGSINYITTIVQMRAPGMTFFRLPMTIWAMLITAILQAFALPVLTAAVLMQIADRLLGTCFFIPEGLMVADAPAKSGGGQVLLWQHLFWFYSHPAVYIMLLPAMGMASDILSTMARKPLFGYRPMVYSMLAIAALGFIVWGHHMFVSGMQPLVGAAFMLSTILIALPSGIKTFNWLATLWGGRLQLTTGMLFCIGFVAMFVIGGLSGVLMAVAPVTIFIHDTYYIVAHFHYVLFGGTSLIVIGAIYHWYPKMFGRLMSERLGKVHFFTTFVLMNCVFFPMHFLGAQGLPRRYADFTHSGSFAHLQPINEFITYSAFALVAVQVVFVLNFFGSLVFGRRSGPNPWNANSLEWVAPSPPPHGNFLTPLTVYRGPYEYSVPGRAADYWLQTEVGEESHDKGH